MDLISVVIPVYNTYQYLDECITSVICQSYKNIEIILVNDGSTDNSGVLCKKYSEVDTRISVINKCNGGLSSARLAGFKKAIGKYIYFMDSDDYLEKELLKKLHTTMVEKNTDIGICSFRRFGMKQDIYNIDVPKDILGHKEIGEYLIESCIGGITKKEFPDLATYMWMRLFRRDKILENFFYSEREYYTEDSLFNLEYLRNCNSASVVNEPLYNYRYNNESLTNQYRKNKWEMLLKRQMFYVEYFNEYGCSQKMKIRLDYALLRAVYWGIDNELRLESSNEFYKKASIILNDENVKEMIRNINLQYMGIKDKIWYFMIKNKMLKLIYFIKRR